METPPIRHARSELRGEFVMERDGIRVGELTYALAGSRMTILHTEVAAIACAAAARRESCWTTRSQLARAENLKVASRCSYASAMFARTPAYADVLAGAGGR